MKRNLIIEIPGSLLVPLLVVDAVPGKLTKLTAYRDVLSRFSNTGRRTAIVDLAYPSQRACESLFISRADSVRSFETLTRMWLFTYTWPIGSCLQRTFTAPVMAC